MDEKASYLPEIIYKHIVINDDYVAANYKENKLDLLRGKTSDKKITIFKYSLAENLTAFNEEQKQHLEQLIQEIDKQEPDIIAHESQHIHNNAIGYNYIANSDNIYECMMLSLADEMSAMVAGYLHQTGDIDRSVMKMIDNLSIRARQIYIQKQFANHFYELKKVHGENKNLYEYKFDNEKIKKLVDYYFTIDNQKVMNQMAKSTHFLLSKFMIDMKLDINKFISHEISMIQNQQKSQTL